MILVDILIEVQMAGRHDARGNPDRRAVAPFLDVNDHVSSVALTDADVIAAALLPHRFVEQPKAGWRRDAGARARSPAKDSYTPA